MNSKIFFNHTYRKFNFCNDIFLWKRFPEKEDPFVSFTLEKDSILDQMDFCLAVVQIWKNNYEDMIQLRKIFFSKHLYEINLLL